MNLGFPIHPHMLRHGIGFKLANQGVNTRALQHYLGHASITAPRLGRSARQFRAPLKWAFVPPELRAGRRQVDVIKIGGRWSDAVA